MATFSLVVMYPDAHRTTVKVTQNTTILQILEDVCRKKDLKANEWNLKFHNKIVDLNNSVRFSGVPNNATLEMVKCEIPRVEKAVKIGIHLESGERLNHEFLPQQSLWEILQYWHSNGHSVLPPSETVDNPIEPVCIYMREEVIGANALQAKTLRLLGLTQGSAVIRLYHRPVQQLREQANVSAPLPTRAVKSDENFDEGEVRPSKQSKVPERKPDMIDLIRDELREVRPAPRNTTNDERESSVSISVTKISEVDEPEPRTSQSQKMATEPEPTEVDLQPVITCAEKYAPAGKLELLGDEDALLYHSDDVNVENTNDIPDAFYEVTTTDIHKMHRDLQGKVEELDNVPLMIAANREMQQNAAMLSQMNTYPVTVVRIRFPDRYVLQRSFKVVTTVGSVVEFVLKFLADSNAPIHLFTAPPKTVLNRDARLIEQGLVGMAVVYVGSDDSSANLLLRHDVLERVSSPEAVFAYVAKNQSGAEGSSSHPAVASSEHSEQSGKSEPKSNTNSSSFKKTPVPDAPKWFRDNRK